MNWSLTTCWDQTWILKYLTWYSPHHDIWKHCSIVSAFPIRTFFCGGLPQYQHCPLHINFLVLELRAPLSFALSLTLFPRRRCYLGRLENTSFFTYFSFGLFQFDSKLVALQVTCTVAFTTFTFILQSQAHTHTLPEVVWAVAGELRAHKLPCVS